MLLEHLGNCNSTKLESSSIYCCDLCILSIVMEGWLTPYTASAPIAPAGFQHLAAALPASRLRTLDVSANALGPEDAQLLLGIPLPHGIYCYRRVFDTIQRS